MTLFGGAPGAGKTAFTMQAAVDALRLTPTLRALVCNAEMPSKVLLDRQLARLSGIDATTIRYRRFAAEHGDRLDQGLRTLETVADRLAFVKPPFDLANVAASADAFGADLLVLDYIQRIAPPGQHADNRASVNSTMGFLREFADAGVAVLVLSSVGRTKDTKGRSSYSGDGLNLASFRESSELEFGADDAFILVPDENADYDTVTVTLRHLKARHTAPKDLVLDFDRRRQRFAKIENPNAWNPGHPLAGRRRYRYHRGPSARGCLTSLAVAVQESMPTSLSAKAGPAATAASAGTSSASATGMTREVSDDDRDSH